jgi:zinc D-Ala-D-Ala carboxypeptidase
MNLSKNLSLAEVTKSATAKRRGIANEPTIEHLENLKAVAENIFQPIREEFMCPIFVSSGYRSEALNQAIGGVKPLSIVKVRLDLDADVYGVITNADIFHFALDRLDFDQLIWEFGTDENPDWVHISFNKDSKIESIKSGIRQDTYRMGKTAKYYAKNKKARIKRRSTIRSTILPKLVRSTVHS